MDVTVRHAAAEHVVARAARRPGEAARAAEREKHARYPGDRLTPFVIEAPGRLGGEARQWLVRQARSCPEDQQSFELIRAYNPEDPRAPAMLSLKHPRDGCLVLSIRKIPNAP